MAAYTELKVWQMSMDLVESTYELTKKLPKDETYGLCAQMRRAAVAVPSNIAEGYGRESSGYVQQFLRVALGSVRELETQLMLVVRLGFVTDQASERARSECDQVGKMLRSLIRSVQGSVRDERGAAQLPTS